MLSVLLFPSVKFNRCAQFNPTTNSWSLFTTMTNSHSAAVPGNWKNKN